MQTRTTPRARRTRAARLALSAALAPLLLRPLPDARAGTVKTWTGPSGGSWTTGTWSPAGAPVNNDSALFSLSPSAAYSVTFNGDFIVGSTFTILNSLTLDAAGDFPFTFLQNNATSDLRAINQYIGNVGRATYAQSAATNVAETLYVGYAPSSSGAYQLTGGLLSTFHGKVGHSGYATLAQSAGTHSVAYDLILGTNAGSSGSYSLSGLSSTLSAPNQYVGYSGAASFAQSGGTNTISTNLYVTNGTTSLYLGYNAGSTGTYSLTGGRLALSSSALYGGNEYVGYAGSGTFIHTNGATNTLTSSSTYLSIAHLAGSSGTYSLGTFTTLSIPSAEYVGNAGAGTFIQSGGTHSFTGANGTTYAPTNGLFLAYAPNSSGTYRLSAGTLSTTNSQYLGYAGTGSFSQTGGKNTLTGTSSVSLYLGFNAGATGSYSLSGGTVIAPAINIGYSGTGSVSHTGGSLSASSFLALGGNAGSYGHYSLSGTGSVTVSSYEYVGLQGTATFAQSGGTHSIGNTNTNSGGLYLGVSLSGAGSYILSGGSLSASNVIVGYNGAGTFLHSSGTLSAQALTLGFSFTGAYSLSGTGSLSTGQVLFGYYGSGTFVQSGGIHNTYGIYLGVHPSSKGTYLLQGGTLAAASIYYGNYASTFTQTGGTLATTSLPNIPTTTYLDFSGGTIVVSYTGTSPADRLRAYLQSGQIRSTTAGPNYAIGYADTASTLTAIVTFQGDANLDGTLGADDYALLDSSLAQSLPNSHWADGDFDYDGQITSADYFLIDAAYLQQQGGSPSPAFLSQRESQFGPAYVSQLLSTIPEPSSLLAIFGVVFVRFRKRF